MKIFQSDLGTLHIANSVLREEKGRCRYKREAPLEKLVPWLVEDAYSRLGVERESRNDFLDFCKIQSKKKNGLRVGILYAHGKNYFGNWCYSDGIFPKPVQSWIDANENSYDLMLLHVCNPKGSKPVIRKPIVVVPRDIVSLMPGDNEDLVIPGKGAAFFNRDKMEKCSWFDLIRDLEPYPN